MRLGWQDRMRAAGTLVLTPIRFSVVTGHARSSTRRRAMDRSGAPLPWFTYPTIDLLANTNLSSRSVLEFGAGQSTRWWSTRGVDLVAIESNPDWFQELTIQGIHGDIRLLDDGLTQFPDDLQKRRFDIIVIDGLHRQTAARLALWLLADDGFVIQDDSMGEWSDSAGHYDIVELFAEAGFARIDLYGFAPGVWRRRCTSIYFRDSCFLWRNILPPVTLDPGPAVRIFTDLFPVRRSPGT